MTKQVESEMKEMFGEMLQTECAALRTLMQVHFEILKLGFTCLKIYALASSFTKIFCDFTLYHLVKPCCDINTSNRWYIKSIVVI